MTQPEREAFTDVLVYAMYADRSLSLSEDEAFETEMAGLAWAEGDGTLPKSDYVNQSITRARGIRRHTIEEDEFLAARAQVLQGQQTRQRLLDALENVTWADGDEAGDERTLKQRLRDLLGASG